MSGVAGPGTPAGGLREQEPPQRSPARTPSPWRSAFFVLVALSLAVALTWGLVVPKVLVVRSVAVTGTHLVPASEVRAAAAIRLGAPMTGVDVTAVAGRVERIPRVESAQVSRAWPGRIVIAVRERTPALAVAVPGQVSAAGGFDLVDRSGVIVRWARRRPRGMPLFKTAQAPSALRGSPALEAAAAVLGELPRGLARSVTDVSTSGPRGVTIRLSHGVTVVWGGTGRAGEKARELAILMRTHARYYDISAPGSAVTR